jgi:hypothetical protein
MRAGIESTVFGDIGMYRYTNIYKGELECRSVQGKGISLSLYTAPSRTVLGSRNPTEIQTKLKQKPFSSAMVVTRPRETKHIQATRDNN